MCLIVKVRAVNRSKFLAIPCGLVEKIAVRYMSVELDEVGRLIYTPISETASVTSTSVANQSKNTQAGTH